MDASKSSALGLSFGVLGALTVAAVSSRRSGRRGGILAPKVRGDGGGLPHVDVSKIVEDEEKVNVEERIKEKVVANESTTTKDPSTPPKPPPTTTTTTTTETIPSHSRLLRPPSTLITVSTQTRETNRSRMKQVSKTPLKSSPSKSKNKTSKSTYTITTEPITKSTSTSTDVESISSMTQTPTKKTTTTSTNYLSPLPSPPTLSTPSPKKTIPSPSTPLLKLKSLLLTTPLILCIDIGSSSIRSSFYDTNLNPIPYMSLDNSVSIKYSLNKNSSLKKILEIIDVVVDQILSRYRLLPTKPEIIGIGFASAVMNLIGLNCLGEQITEFMLYSNTNNGASPGKTEDDRIKTGCRDHSSYGLSQIERLKSDEIVWKDITVFGTISGCVISRWTDSMIKVSYSEASWTGMFNINEFDWISGSTKMPGLEDFRDNEFRIENDRVFNFGERWGELKNVKVYRGVGDGGCANLGSLCFNRERVAVTVGTSAAVRVVCEEEVEGFGKGLWCYRICGRRKLIGGAMTDGGSMVEWWEKMYDTKITSEIVEDAMAREECQLVAVPFLEGERSVGWRDNANCTIYGMNRESDKVDVLRAIFEGVSFGICRILEEMVECGVVDREESTLVCSGGALEANPQWRRLICDVCGFKLCDFGEGSATSRGTKSQGTKRRAGNTIITVVMSLHKERSDEFRYHNN
ncbi:hypothetical protein TL16_g10530 [Triparma laevis f. inornata]|uniref:Carbohydrate kinase FGGY N-terminal domain-containing protein n=1 Tax=Triparma laevis f. inornata TaxID=1714386 RepID=A0A9W7BGR4_9STRA|nr:hypothetical protein TL16_g10530 [Triparma laevis f. inornata]